MLIRPVLERLARAAAPSCFYDAANEAKRMLIGAL